MRPEEIATMLGYHIVRIELCGEQHFHVRMSSWPDLDAFIDICEEESDRNVVPIRYNDGSGEAHWMYFEYEMRE